MTRIFYKYYLVVSVRGIMYADMICLDFDIKWHQDAYQEWGKTKSILGITCVDKCVKLVVLALCCPGSSSPIVEAEVISLQFVSTQSNT